MTRTDNMNRIFGRNLANRIRRRMVVGRYHRVALSEAFIWGATPEGVDFWMNLYHQHPEEF